MHDKILLGDNLELMRDMESGVIDLIYADPPFNTGKDWGAFNDKWEGGLKGYLKFMEPRLVEMHRLLKDTGSIYLHCNHKSSHYLKVMMDGIFGMKHFRNEIVWHYNRGSPSSVDFPRNHDVILRYAKSDAYIFNADAIRVSYSQATIKRRKYRHKDVRNGKSDLHALGKLPDTVWEYGLAQHGVKYPTQKPLKLLERIIKASSNQGDVVFDPFCGSGTTLVAADRLQRKWIGIDQSQEAVDISQERIDDERLELFDNEPSANVHRRSTDAGLGQDYGTRLLHVDEEA